jgi:hypothetical protein
VSNSICSEIELSDALNNRKLKAQSVGTVTSMCYHSLNSPACSCVSITLPASSLTKKSRTIQGTMQLLLVISPCRAGSVYNDVINHTRIACVHVINTHVTTGFDRGVDDFARLVHNVTGPVENITAI